MPAESAADHLAWEQELLGWPVSVHPLAMLTDQPNRLVPLRASYVAQPSVTVVGVRLPGWTGGPGFFLGDGGDTFIQVRAGKQPRPGSVATACGWPPGRRRMGRATGSRRRASPPFPPHEAALSTHV